jgi:hypothetical protein
VGIVVVGKCHRRIDPRFMFEPFGWPHKLAALDPIAIPSARRFRHGCFVRPNADKMLAVKRRCVFDRDMVAAVKR